MGTSLVGLLPQNTYVGLIKVGNNTALNATLKTLSDGAGNDLPMQASTTAINFTGTTTGLASGVAGAIQFSNGSAFASDAANLFWDDTNNRLGVGTNVPTRQVEFVGSTATPSALALRYGTATGGGPLIELDATAAASGKSYLIISTSSSNGAVGAGGLGIFDGTDYRFVIKGGNVGIGETTPTARTHIKGSGSTSATTSLLVQNSAGTATLTARDDGKILIRDYISGVGENAYLRLNNSNGFEGGYNEGSGGSFQAGGSTVNLNIGGSKILQGYSGGISIGKGASNPVASAQLEVFSTTKGFLPPVMTTTQKNAIASPAAGLVVYDSTAKSPGYYDGTNWGYTGGALQNTTGNGGTLNVSFAAGNIVNLTLNATTTLAFANSVIGTYIIQVTQSAGGGSSLVYPASVKWSGGTAPTLSTAVGKTDILTFYYDGTNYYGNYSLNY